MRNRKKDLNLRIFHGNESIYSFQEVNASVAEDACRNRVLGIEQGIEQSSTVFLNRSITHCLSYFPLLYFAT